MLDMILELLYIEKTITFYFISCNFVYKDVIILIRRQCKTILVIVGISKISSYYDIRYNELISLYFTTYLKIFTSIQAETSVIHAKMSSQCQFLAITNIINGFL